MEGLKPSITILPEEMLLRIVEQLDSEDRIAFANTCGRFRQICLDSPRAMRKVDLSRRLIRKDRIKDFFRDKEMARNIRELNLNNQRIMNWEMDDDLEEFIMRICPQLETLHLLNCGKMNLQRLHRILLRAPKLTSLSFSIMDLTAEDIEFIIQNRICLENIKRLHIETALSTGNIRILNYTVLSRCKRLEELKIFTWDLPELEIPRILIHPRFLNQQLTATEPLEHLHSLQLEVLTLYDSPDFDLISSDLSDLIASLVKRKSRGTKWKRLWISDPVGSIYLLDPSGPEEISSLQEFSTNIMFQVIDMKTLFRSVKDGVVRKLFLNHTEILKYHKSIGRIGGDALQGLFLRGCDSCVRFENSNYVLSTLFSSCCNIKELDLLDIHFEKNVCESLSNLKHLEKLQLQHCAIAPTGTAEDQVTNQANASLLTMVGKCPDVTEFYVSGYCKDENCKSSRLIGNNDLLPLAKWTKLKSLTCIEITITRLQYREEGTFLNRVVENCKLLTTLRLGIAQYNHESYFSFMEHAKQLKHVVLFVGKGLSFESDEFWKLLSCPRNVERLCIVNPYDGPIHIGGIVRMLRCLHRLNVLHLHVSRLRNTSRFLEEMGKAIETERSDRGSCFQYLIEEEEEEEEEQNNAAQCRFLKKLLPLNSIELCHMVPRIPL